MFYDIARSIRHPLATVKRLLNSKKSPQAVFTEIFEKRLWSPAEDTVSGSGSNMVQTAPIRAALPAIIAEYRIASMLDVPCGDFFWMKHVDLSNVHYRGGDIVQPLVESTRRLYSANGIQNGAGRKEFQVVDIINDPLPKVDLIFCRDCFVHLSFEQIFKSISNFKSSGSRYILTTSYFSGVKRNKDVFQGDWRAINLQESPFNFPQPLRIVDERGWYDKAAKGMGLWRLSDLPTPQL